MIFRKAFTLIELLVVIAIIAILAAILFPVFAAAKEAAKSTSCLANQKNVSLSVIMYAGDVDDHMVPWNVTSVDPANGLPLGTLPNPAPGTMLSGNWTFLIQPYVKSQQILKCPSFSAAHMSEAFGDPVCDGDPAVFGMPYNDPTQFLSTYGVALPVNSNNYNFWVVCDPTGSEQHWAYPGAGYLEDVADVSGGWNDGITPTTYQDFSLGQVLRPAETVMVGDGETMLTGSNSYAPAYVNSIYSSFGCEGQYRHKNGGPNTAFVDGHSKYLPTNPESILAVDTMGCVYEKYYSWDK